MLIDCQIDRQVKYTLIAFENPLQATPIGEGVRPKEVPVRLPPRHRADDAVGFRALHHRVRRLVGKIFPAGEEPDDREITSGKWLYSPKMILRGAQEAEHYQVKLTISPITV